MCGCVIVDCRSLFKSLRVKLSRVGRIEGGWRKLLSTWLKAGERERRVSRQEDGWELKQTAAESQRFTGCVHYTLIPSALSFCAFTISSSFVSALLPEWVLWRSPTWSRPLTPWSGLFSYNNTFSSALFRLYYHDLPTVPICNWLINNMLYNFNHLLLFLLSPTL